VSAVDARRPVERCELGERVAHHLRVPSKSRPQPHAKSVSPQKTRGSSPDSTKAMWPAVWAGNVEHGEGNGESREA
jgi:hypothetical protein